MLVMQASLDFACHNEKRYKLKLAPQVISLHADVSYFLPVSEKKGYSLLDGCFILLVYDHYWDKILWRLLTSHMHA